DYDGLASTSSIATAVNSKTIKAMPLLRPSQKIVERFEHLVAPWFDQVLRLDQENQTLATLRDTLLPRLMSGTLRVKAAEAEVEAAL
ncbi:MAG: restriction endonuclease subunit S, partial [Pseudomonadota bacterium]